MAGPDLPGALRLSFLTPAGTASAGTFEPYLYGCVCLPVALERRATGSGSRYLARLATCSDCHSLGVAGPRQPHDRFLAGSDVPFVEGGLI